MNRLLDEHVAGADLDDAARIQGAEDLKTVIANTRSRVIVASTSPLDRLAHDHVFPRASHKANARRTMGVVLLAATMMVGESITGYLTGLMALLADEVHLATHAGALSVAAIAYSYTSRHAADQRLRFGTGTVGDLAEFASALVLAVITIEIGIGVKSVIRLVQPPLQH